jgi:hypothetical protein
VVGGGGQQRDKKMETMMKKRRNLFRGMVIFAAMLIDPRMLFGCGPFMPEIIFTHTIHPDFPLDRYAGGELGVLQPTYARSYLLVAYRRLNGVGVNANEAKALVSLWRERLLIDDEAGRGEALGEWTAERKKITGAGAPPTIDIYYSESGPNYYFNILNCHPDAFKTAAITLRDRAQRFGQESATVIDWTKAQDQVFSNCSGGKNFPTPAPADAQPLARADRVYQMAAANFYARNFDEAVRLFGEIAKDNASPWRQTASLLIARSLIRKATLREKNDMATLAEAENQLKRVLDDQILTGVHASARRLLEFVQFRLNPEKRAHELAQAVTKKNEGPSIKQDVIDYTRLLDRYEAEDHKVTLTASAKQDDITDWLFTFQADGEAALEHSLQRWAETSSPAWMIAALTKIHAKHPKAPALLPSLLKEAAKAQPDSPAFATAAYHIVRLTLEAGRKDDARQKLDEILAIKTPMPVSSRNQFLVLRTKLARNAEEFFKFAQRAPAAVSYNDDGQEVPVNESWLSKDDIDQNGDSKMKPYLAGRVSFAEDSVSVMNDGLPLATLKDAALGTALPAHLRLQLTIAAWTRAYLLDDDDAAKTLAPALLALAPEMKAQLTAYLTAKDAAGRKDAALYLILKFPGVRPLVDVGMGRTTPLAQIDNYRDNWWCGAESHVVSETNEDRQSVPQKARPEAPAFLTAAQQSTVAVERKKLDALEIGPNELCLRAVDWAKRNPADPRAPEVLALAVKATRFGCRDKQTRLRSKLAFDMLHKQYPNSAWAKQTKYYFGEN